MQVIPSIVLSLISSLMNPATTFFTLVKIQPGKYDNMKINAIFSFHHNTCLDELTAHLFVQK